MAYRYERIRVIILKSGFYEFECNKDQSPPFVFIGTIDLYTNSFNPVDILRNRLTHENNAEGIHRNHFGILLQQNHNYNLVVSIIDTCEKSFFISITGPANVSFS